MSAVHIMLELELEDQRQCWCCVQEVFRQRKGIGLPFGLQLHGKTLGIIGMGKIG